MSPTDAQTADSSTVEFLPITEFSAAQREQWLKSGEVPTKEAPATSAESSDAGEQSAEGAPDAPEKASESEPEKPQEQHKPRRGAESRKQELGDDIQDLLAQRAQLRAELETLKGAKGEKAAEPPAATAKQEPGAAPKRPKIADFENYEAYDTALEEYHAAMVDHRVAEALKGRDTQAQKAVIHDGWSERARKVAADPERGKVFERAVAEVGPFLTQAGVSDLIMLSEHGPDILIFLQEHPDETLKMAQSGSIAYVAHQVGVIEARLAAGKPAAVGAEPVPVKPVTKAPPPATELSGTKSAATDPIVEAVKTRDFAVYRAEMNRRETRK